MTDDITRRIADVLTGHRFIYDELACSCGAEGFKRDDHAAHVAEVLARELKIIDAGEGLFVGQYKRVRADTEEVSGRKTFICDSYFNHLQPREDCPNVLHDWPLPAGYIEAFKVAEARLRARWRNKRCPQCGLFGWTAGDKRPAGTNPVMVRAEDTEEEK